MQMHIHFGPDLYYDSGHGKKRFDWHTFCIVLFLPQAVLPYKIITVEPSLKGAGTLRVPAPFKKGSGSMIPTVLLFLRSCVGV